MHFWLALLHVSSSWDIPLLPVFNQPCIPGIYHFGCSKNATLREKEKKAENLQKPTMALKAFAWNWHTSCPGKEWVCILLFQRKWKTTDSKNTV